ncbi:MAG: methyltransferase domain-containing protein [Pedosphaera sp.]|nr:methyltransferase domain-containing protein [Pedosphaera sp.]
MVNKFYVPGEPRATRVHDLFTTIAPRYDLINDLQSFCMHRYWKRRLVQLARVKSGERALDLCCGTGDLAFAMARGGAMITGLDFSASMLAVARQRSRTSQVRNHTSAIQGRKQNLETGTCGFGSPGAVSFVRGDALHLPFRDSHFEVVTMSYGLRNLANFQGGLTEMVRVARPGGRLLVLDFGKPDNALWRGLYFTYLKWCVPWFGRIFCGDSETYSYILESLKNYPAQNGVAAALAEMNCERIRIVKFLGGMMSINYAEKRGL